MDALLLGAAGIVPPGRWGIGVSGGADSVALLRLLNERKDLLLHVAHLDHETREGESAVDAEFVENLARRLGVSVTLRRRSEIERSIDKLPANIPARFRASRIRFFKQLVVEHDLRGVILAHHADDQAETILHRLIRGSGPSSLGGMSGMAMVDGLCIVRPLLNVRSAALRDYLLDIRQGWREDSSNRSMRYRRNQLRMILADNPGLHENLIELGQACAGLRKWIAGSAPVLGEVFSVDELARLPDPIGRRAAGRWLGKRGSPVGKINGAVCDQLIQMSSDMASAPRRHFPGGLLVRRKRGVIFVDRSAGS